jgi:hypoxia up-regulated 1
LFGGGSSSSDEESEVPDTSTSSTQSSPPIPSDIPAAEKKLTLKESNTVPLDITLSFLTTPPMTVAEKRASRERYVAVALHFYPTTLTQCNHRLRLVDYEESAKQRKEEARNSLEGYLYRVRDLLDDSHQDTPFKQCSQESERKAIAQKVSETIVWLHDKGDLAETSQFWDKRNAVEYVAVPCFQRRCCLTA